MLGEKLSNGRDICLPERADKTLIKGSSLPLSIEYNNNLSFSNLESLSLDKSRKAFSSASSSPRLTRLSTSSSSSSPSRE
nr:hypothetical protein Cplu_78 [Cedratvirus plubellavi]